MAAQVLAVSDTADERLLEVGEHLLGAGEYPRAFDALMRASARAEADGELHSARRGFVLASHAVRQLGPEQRQGRLMTYRARARVLLELRELARADEVLRSGLRKAQAAGDPEAAADMLRLHARLAVLGGDLQKGRKRFASAIKMAEKSGNLSIAAEACSDLADAEEGASDLEKAKEAVKRGLLLLGNRRDGPTLAVKLKLSKRAGRFEQRGGNHVAAIALFSQALEVAEKLKDHYEIAGLLGNLGSAYARQKDLGKAVEYAKRAVRASAALGDIKGLARQRFNLALVRLASGQTDQARELLGQGKAAALRSGWLKGVAMCEKALAQLEAGENAEGPDESE
jgi:tetratricopeptide (TPR) repeat protein